MTARRKSSEKRKEKSRDAARCRRSRETEIFTQLADSLPLPPLVRCQLDKAAIVRLTICYLKISEILNGQRWSDDVGEWTKEDSSMDYIHCKALHGFVIILSADGVIVFVNENVKKYLGVQQAELMGHSLLDFVHPCDEEEIQDILADQLHSDRQPSMSLELPSMLSHPHRVFFLRMKNTVTSKGHVNLKSAAYKVMKCTAHVLTDTKHRPPAGEPSFHLSLLRPSYVVMVGEPVPHPFDVQREAGGQAFLSKHSMDLTFTFCDDKVKELLNYDSEDLIGQSLFTFHHPADSQAVESAYRDLLVKGKDQITTGLYRFLAGGGGTAWVVSQAIVVNGGPSSRKPRSVVCVHTVISEVENSDVLVSEVQLRRLSSLPGSSGEAACPSNVESEDDCVGLLTGYSSTDDDNALASPPILLPDDTPCAPPHAMADRLEAGHTKRLSTAVSSYADCFDVRSTSSVCMSSPSVTPMEKFFQTVDVNARPDVSQEVDFEVIDFDMRAPYVPMNGEYDLDLQLPCPCSLLTMSDDVDPLLFGKTEEVFRQEDGLFDGGSHSPHPHILTGTPVVASMEMSPNTRYRHLKRPLDVTSLEKGPPLVKKLSQPTRFGPLGSAKPMDLLQDKPVPQSHHLQIGQRLHQADGIQFNKTAHHAHPGVVKRSILLDLLCKEKRSQFGGDSSAMDRPQFLSDHPMTLSSLSNHDYEVNAPVSCSSLLQGIALLNALDNN